MEILQNVADYGDAPSFIATGVCRLFFVSPHLVRVTFVRTDRRHDGVEEQRVSGHVDWDIVQLQIAHAVFHDALAMLVAKAPVTEAEYVLGSKMAH